MDHQSDEPQTDFLQFLETNMSHQIMSFVDDPDDLVRASAVSRFWYHFAIANGYAKQMCLKSYPELSKVVSIVDASKGANVPTEWEILERDHKVYASLFHALTKSQALPKNCIENAISASSTDRYPDESVVNTLNPRDRFIRRASYWSSKGQNDPHVPETLIYKIKAGIWSLSEINIQPFEAYFQPGNPIYSAKSVRFRIGYPKPRKEVDIGLKNVPEDAPIDHVFVWTYTSPEFPMMQENRLQEFKLPEPVLCLGGYLQIEFMGRVQRQEMDGLFYICVCYVRVLGQSLSPAFDIQMAEQHGKFVLTYHPEKLPSILQATKDGAPCLQLLEEEMLWDRIGLLEDLLRGMQGRPHHHFAGNQVGDEINGGDVDHGDGIDGGNAA